MEVGAYPFVVAVNQTSNKIYAALQTGGDVIVLDRAKGTMTKVPGAALATEFAIDELRNKVYVADPTNNQIVVIDGETEQSSTVAGTGSHLWQVRVNPLTNEFYGLSLISGDVGIYCASPAALPAWALDLFGK